MTATFSRIAAFAQRWPKLLALLLGGVSATGFAPLHFWPLTLLALAGWMALVARNPKGWRAFGTGWAFGVGHFVVGLNWIATAFTYQAAMPAWLGWIAVVLLSLYLAVYPALAAWGAWAFSKLVPAAEAGAAGNDSATPTKAPAFAGTTISFILAFAALWTLAEWLRSWVFTGFAWNPLGATMLWASPPARWIGTYGLSSLPILIAGLCLVAVHSNITSPNTSWIAAGEKPEPPARRQAREQLGFGAFVMLFFGLLYLAPDGSTPQPATAPNRIPITVVQPNVGQADKWEGSKADTNFSKLARLTAPKDDSPRLILWPEAAVPDYLETGYPLPYYDRSPAEARGRLTNLMNPDDLMLLGALKLELDKSGDVVGARNAVMTVHADGTLGPRYDKAHLVPYGEYLPMRPVLSAIGLSRLAPGDIDFWPGPGPHTLDLGAFGRAGLQICYEIIFSGQVVDRAHRPDFIFNPSNDAWFGGWGPPQHLAQARLRAIEEGLPVVRATPTGISAVIDADGRILESIPMHTAGRIDTVLPRAHAPTLFARYGNVLPVGFALLLLALAIAFRRRGR